MERVDRDRHDLVKDLIKSGLTENQSEVIGKAFFGNNNLATKSDLTLLENKLVSKITVIEQTVATKSDIANMKADFLKWLISFLLGIVAINVTTIGVVVSFLGK